MKLWSANGDQRGVVRTQSSLLASQRMGAIACLSFHPHRALLASGSADSIVTLYPIENSIGMGVEQSATSETSRQSSMTMLPSPMSSSVWFSVDCYHVVDLLIWEQIVGCCECYCTGTISTYSAPCATIDFLTIMLSSLQEGHEEVNSCLGFRGLLFFTLSLSHA